MTVARNRILTAVLLGLAALAALTPVADSDIWWHLAAGREMIARRGFLWADPFSLGARGRPWIDLHWLFQLGSYGLFRLGGLAALVAGKAILVAAGAWLWLRAVQAGVGAERPRDGSAEPTPAAPKPTTIDQPDRFNQSDQSNQSGSDADVVRERDGGGGAKRPAQQAPTPEAPKLVAAALLAVALPLGLFFVRHLLLVRPVILTLVFLAAFVFVLERFAGGGRARGLTALPVLTAVWANCQGLWPLGVLTIGCVLGGEGLARLRRRRELPSAGARRVTLALAGCLVAGTLTPYGWRALVLPVKLLLRLVPANANVFSSQVAENVPPLLLARGDPLALLPLIAVALATAGSFAHGRPDRRFGRALIALAFFGLALTANRNVLLFFWMAIPIAVANAAPALVRRLSGRRLLPLIWSATAALTTGLLLFALGRETRLDQPAPFRVPSGSARLIEQDPGAGRIFSADHYGGYLIWSLHPRAAPYLDTRLVLRTADEYAEFLALLEQPDRWEEFARRHPFDHAVLPTDYPDRYLPLAAHLYRSADWRLVYTDGTESLFRHDPDHRRAALDLGARATTDRILTDQARRYPRREVAEAARRQLARLDLALGHPEECLYVLSALPEDPSAQALAGRCHLQIGDLTAAEATGRRMLERDADSVAALDLLALVALARGDLPGGIGWLRKALAADPYDPEARAILDQLESQAAPPGR